MSSLDCQKHETPKTAAKDPSAPVLEITQGRRELARLIGRLLAQEWLHKQRAEKRGHDDAADDDIPAI